MFTTLYVASVLISLFSSYKSKSFYYIITIIFFNYLDYVTGTCFFICLLGLLYEFYFYNRDGILKVLYVADLDRICMPRDRFAYLSFIRMTKIITNDENKNRIISLEKKHNVDLIAPRYQFIERLALLNEYLETNGKLLTDDNTFINIVNIFLVGRGDKHLEIYPCLSMFNPGDMTRIVADSYIDAIMNIRRVNINYNIHNIVNEEERIKYIVYKSQMLIMTKKEVETFLEIIPIHDNTNFIVELYSKYYHLIIKKWNFLHKRHINVDEDVITLEPREGLLISHGGLFGYSTYSITELIHSIKSGSMMYPDRRERLKDIPILFDLLSSYLSLYKEYVLPIFNPVGFKQVAELLELLKNNKVINGERERILNILDQEDIEQLKILKAATNMYEFVGITLRDNLVEFLQCISIDNYTTPNVYEYIKSVPTMCVKDANRLFPIVLNQLTLINKVSSTSIIVDGIEVD